MANVLDLPVVGKGNFKIMFWILGKVNRNKKNYSQSFHVH